MTTTDLIPFLKGYLEGKETLDSTQVEFLKKTLKEVTSYSGLNAIRQPSILDQQPQRRLNPLPANHTMYQTDGLGHTTVVAR